MLSLSFLRVIWIVLLKKELHLEQSKFQRENQSCRWIHISHLHLVTSYVKEWLQKNMESVSHFHWSCYYKQGRKWNDISILVLPDGRMASLIQWTWGWANSRGCWRTGKPGVLQSLGSQRVGYDWATEQQNGMHVYIPYKSLPLKPNLLCDGWWRCGLQKMTSSWGWIHHKWD